VDRTIWAVGWRRIVEPSLDSFTSSLKPSALLADGGGRRNPEDEPQWEEANQALRHETQIEEADSVLQVEFKIDKSNYINYTLRLGFFRLPRQTRNCQKME
jgi:hypothetical protein